MRSIAAPALVFWSLVAGPPPGHAATAVATASWRVAPREAWVQAAPLPYGDSVQAPSATGLLLQDRQIRITAEGDDRYEHTVARLTAAQASPVRIDLDPRFQQLVIHALRLTHGADAAIVFTAAQLGTQLRTQAAEADPRQRELDPRLQLTVEVPGARAGDLLDCEYTIHSRTAQDPGLFVGHYAAQWSGDANQAVRWERLHVSWPPGRPLQFRVSSGGTGVVPQVRTQPGELDVQWRRRQPVSESDTPRWFDREGLVQLSDFADWAQVAALLAPRYGAAESPLLPIQPPASAAPQLIGDAVRLLQTKVHPLGSLGTVPYAPADPAVVLQRGYGDSRDLARLLASLLRRLGFDAQVALADSRRGALLPDLLPSPFILDTGVVVVHAFGAEYWLNAATPAPLAALDTVDPGDLRHALLITAGRGRMMTLPPPAPDARLRVVTQQFDLRAAATEPATLMVITQYHGGWAQAVRAELFAQSPAQLQLAQIQSVAQDYPAANADGVVQLQDLPDDHTVQVTARFRLPQALGATQDRHFDFFAESLADAVQPRDEATRQLPLAVPWPMKLEQHIDARLPPGFEVPPDLFVLPGTLQIETAAFRYRREVRIAPGAVHITHSYVTLSDHVAPADYPAFVQANARVYAALGLSVRPARTWWQHAWQWLADHALIIVAAAVMLATLATRIGRRRQPR